MKDYIQVPIWNEFMCKERIPSRYLENTLSLNYSLTYPITPSLATDLLVAEADSIPKSRQICYFKVIHYTCHGEKETW